MKSFIKGIDLFGHIIQLNFNQKGSSHKTTIGGAFSFLIYAFMSFYIIINVQKLIFNLDDKNTTEKGIIDLDEKEIVQYNETNLFNFFVIRK